eukprot:COSAG05_NODE_1779_length_4104_cov_5.080020_2_plen_879_part_00
MEAASEPESAAESAPEPEPGPGPGSEPEPEPMPESEPTSQEPDPNLPPESAPEPEAEEEEEEVAAAQAVEAEFAEGPLGIVFQPWPYVGIKEDTQAAALPQLREGMKLVGIQGVGSNHEYTPVEEGTTVDEGGLVLRRAGRPVRLSFQQPEVGLLFRVVAPDGALMRKGAEKSSEPMVQLANATIFKVCDVRVLADGSIRLRCANQDNGKPAGWISKVTGAGAVVAEPAEADPLKAVIQDAKDSLWGWAERKKAEVALAVEAASAAATQAKENAQQAAQKLREQAAHELEEREVLGLAKSVFSERMEQQEMLEFLAQELGEEKVASHRQAVDVWWAQQHENLRIAAQKKAEAEKLRRQKMAQKAEEELRKLTAEAEALEAGNDELRAELAKHDEALGDIELAEADALEAKEAIEAAYPEKFKLCQELETENASLASSLAQAQDASAAKERVVRELKTNLHHYQEEEEHLERNNERLAREVTANAEEKQQLEQGREQLQAEIDALQKELPAYRDEVDKGQVEAQALHAEKLQLDRELAELAAQYKAGVADMNEKKLDLQLFKKLFTSEASTTVEEITVAEQINTQMKEAHLMAKKATQPTDDDDDMSAEDWLEKSNTSLRSIEHKTKKELKKLPPRPAPEPEPEQPEPEPEQGVGLEPEPEPHVSSESPVKRPPSGRPPPLNELVLTTLLTNIQLNQRLNGYCEPAARQQTHSDASDASGPSLELSNGRCLQQRKKVQGMGHGSWPERHLRVEGKSLLIYESAERTTRNDIRSSSIMDMTGCQVVPVEDAKFFSLFEGGNPRTPWWPLQITRQPHQPGGDVDKLLIFEDRDERDRFCTALQNVTAGRDWNETTDSITGGAAVAATRSLNMRTTFAMPSS